LVLSLAILNEHESEEAARKALYQPFVTRRSWKGHSMKVLVIDVGGTNVKVLASGHRHPRKFPSGPHLTPPQMIAKVKKLAANWQYDAISIGLPGPVLMGQLILDPHNLGPGWVGFDFSTAFGVPVKLVNDAAMQALGSYRGGKMIFFGLGTGLGTALVINGVAESREIAHLPYKKRTYEDYVGIHGLRRLGRREWRKNVAEIVNSFVTRIHADDIVLGGGNVRKLKKLPRGCRAGDNANAFLGGFRLWEAAPTSATAKPRILKLLSGTQPGSRQTKSVPARPRRAA
jgi:polyphosphate glucokinase